MAHLRRTLAFFLLFSGACPLLTAQLQSAQQCQQGAPGSAPCVYQVDPPNWWTNMPSPMLLIYGRNLQNSRITVHGKDAAIARTTFSENGHYAFVWLKNTGAAPRTLDLQITASSESIHIPYELKTRHVEDAAFRGFSAADSLYLIMTDRFADGDPSNDPQPSERDLPRGWHGGDFKGIEQHLDYIHDLGITSIWITPAYSNAGSRQAYHGYSATNMYATDPHFGSIADFQHLAGAIHDRRMKFVLDTVPNHVGPAHPWALDPPTPDWFHGTVAHHDPAVTEFQSLPDPHANWQQQKDVTQGWFANVLPDLNQENPLVAQYLIQNAIWWIETGPLDALRIDTFPYVNRAFWQQFNREIHQLYPHLTEVGEVYNPDPTITSYFAGGEAHNGIDTHLWTPFDFPTFFALRDVFAKHQPLMHLTDVWEKDHLYPHPERLVPFIGNHDNPRFLSLSGVSVADLKLALGIVLTMRGMPQLYSGDEIAMRGGEDPDNRHDFPGGFTDSSQDSNAFTAAGRTPEQTEVHDWTAALLNFRNSRKVFVDGGQQDLFADDTALAYLRGRNLEQGCKSVGSNAGSQDGNERVMIAVNNSAQPRTLEMVAADTALVGCSSFTPAAGTQGSASIAGGKITLSLQPKQLAVFDVK